jgi:hypothetical protein
MNLYEQALVVYNEYVQRIEERVRQEEAARLQHEIQRIREEEAMRQQKVLIRILTLRFGMLPEHMLVRIRRADTVTISHWAERELTAESLDDVFA